MSLETYNKAMEDMNKKELALSSAKREADAHPQSKTASLDGNTTANLNFLQQLKKESSGLDGSYNKVCSDLTAAKNAKTKDNKKIKQLEDQKTALDKQRSDKRAQIAQQDLKYQNAKKEFENEKREYAAAQQKLTNAQNAYNAAVKNVDKERPWYLKVGKAIDNTIAYGQKVFKMTDWDKMEKAVTAAGIAVGRLKEPPEKLVKALDTMQKYFGYINTSISVNEAVGSLKEMIAAGQRYSKAGSDSQKMDAIAAISISTLNTLEKTLNIKGGLITTSIASVCNQFLTALIKGVAATCRLASNNSHGKQLLVEVMEKNCDPDIHTRAGQAYCNELALKMVQDGKTDAQVLEAIDAYSTLKKAA
jgi:myosin heavy subunit